MLEYNVKALFPSRARSLSTDKAILILGVHYARASGRDGQISAIRAKIVADKISIKPAIQIKRYLESGDTLII